MDSFKKVGTIAKAMITPLPVGERWYEDRLAICNSCENNVKGVLCPEGRKCTACGCCVERKCATKSEVCGMVYLNQPPKWNAIATKSRVDPQLVLELMTLDKGKISLGPDGFVIDLFKSEDVNIEFIFQLYRDGFRYVSHSSSCDCTAVNVEIPDKYSAKFNMKISTKDFKEAITQRSMTINYRVGNGTVDRKVGIIFRYKK